MTELSFVDTNILVYAYDSNQPRKRSVASDLLQRLWQERKGRASMQVMNEFYVTVTKKLRPAIDVERAWDDVLALMAWDPQPMNREVLIGAREVERRYLTSWWDATIVAAAQAQRCTILLSEDFQDGMVFGQLKVRNPFVPRVQEPQAEYQVKLLPRPLHRARGRPAKATL
jgi:predicted nucleic acid-binding protein